MSLTNHTLQGVRRERGTRLPRGVVIACACMLLAIGALAAGRHGAEPSSTVASADDPAACCRRMIAAEIAGDVDAYLDCFTGELRGSLAAELAAKAPVEQAAELRTRARGLTGHATTNVVFAQPDRATLELERIFTHENMREQIELRKISGAWKFSAITDRVRATPTVPYGTVASPIPNR